MNKETVKKLAVKHGYISVLHGQIIFDEAQLQTFAEAVIKQFVSEQEPVAYEYIDADGIAYVKDKPTYKGFYFSNPLYKLELKNDN